MITHMNKSSEGMPEGAAPFRFYKKTTLTMARPLSEREYIRREGVIDTLEGPAPFEPGDYLGLDRKGEYPIKKATMESHYVLLEALGDGWGYYRSLDIRKACQMKDAFILHDQHGKSGDYIVYRGQQHPYIVDRELFDESFAEVVLGEKDQVRLRPENEKNLPKEATDGAVIATVERIEEIDGMICYRVYWPLGAGLRCYSSVDANAIIEVIHPAVAGENPSDGSAEPLA